MGCAGDRQVMLLLAKIPLGRGAVAKGAIGVDIAFGLCAFACRCSHGCRVNLDDDSEQRVLYRHHSTDAVVQRQCISKLQA